MRDRCGLVVPRDTFVSLYSEKPKIAIPMTRAAFGPMGAYTSAEHAERVSVRRSRRSFLRGVMGLALGGVLGLIAWSALSKPPAQTPTYVCNPSASPGGNVLATAASVAPNSSVTINDSTWVPILLIQLDNGQFVAYRGICMHAGCQVQSNPYNKLIQCPCHGAVYDPYHGAQVIAGPAPSPLTTIPIA